VAVGYGVTFGGGRGHPSVASFINSGAFLGLFLMLVYSGREHFRTAFARGLGLPARGNADTMAIWGARATMLGVILMVVQIATLGIEWWMALLYTFWLLLVPLVMARMLAESGVYFLNPRTYPCAMLWGFLGATAMGRQSLMVFALMTVALLISAMLALLPFAVSALRITDDAGVRIGRVAVWGLLTVALGVAVMVPFNLRLQYRHGAMTAGDQHWTAGLVPRFAADNVSVVTRQLEAQGALEASDRMRGWRRIAAASPRTPSVIAFGIALALVLMFGAARHRFARWPLHPVLFAVMGVWPTAMVGFSFLLGWLVKSFVMDYCGARIYQAGKPVMLGLVAGEVIGALVPVIVGFIHYAVQGSPAPSYVVIPG
jgi:hypothetical protein